MDRWHKVLDGKRLGLITSISGVDRYLNSTIDILHKKIPADSPVWSGARSQGKYRSRRRC
uniref:hypothetical protein n=1 Tax=Clostridium sp. NkU-1 TaxID=1095009 RepID=UPI000AC08000